MDLARTHGFTHCAVGIARRDVTPPAGIYARSWAASRHDVAEEVHQPLTATALVMRPVHIDDLTDALVAAIVEARNAVRPAWITYRYGRCTLAANRDFWAPDIGRHACGYNPAAPADDTVLVARVTGEDGALVATPVNYACHPTTLAWQNRLISPDYVGAMRETLESIYGAPCLFLSGSAGDLGPREGFVGDPAVADRNGRQLAYAAAAAIEGLPPPASRFVYTGASDANLATWASQSLDDTVLRRAGIPADRAPDPPLTPPQIMAADQYDDYIMAPVSGIFEPFVEMGALIIAGQTIGQIHSIEQPFEPPTPVSARSNGLLISQRAFPLVRQGDCVATLARPFRLP